MSSDKTIKVPKSLHKEIDEIAWGQRTTKAGIVRLALDIIADTSYPEAGEPEPQVMVKVRGVDEELWERALASAHRGGKTMAEALADAVQKMAKISPA